MQQAGTSIENMVTWVNRDLRGYIVSIRGTLLTTNLGLQIATYVHETHLDLTGYSTDTAIGYLRDVDLQLFAQYSSLIIKEFGSDRLRSGDKPFEKSGVDNRVITITRAFGANKKSLVWQNPSSL